MNVMSKYNWHMKHNGANRYWVILNSETYKDVGILESRFLKEWGQEQSTYILYKGHLTLGYYNTLRAAKQAFALRITKGSINYD